MKTLNRLMAVLLFGLVTGCGNMNSPTSSTTADGTKANAAQTADGVMTGEEWERIVNIAEGYLQTAPDGSSVLHLPEDPSAIGISPKIAEVLEKSLTQWNQRKQAGETSNPGMAATKVSVRSRWWGTQVWLEREDAKKLADILDGVSIAAETFAEYQSGVPQLDAWITLILNGVKITGDLIGYWINLMLGWGAKGVIISKPYWGPNLIVMTPWF